MGVTYGNIDGKSMTAELHRRLNHLGIKYDCRWWLMRRYETTWLSQDGFRAIFREDKSRDSEGATKFMLEGHHMRSGVSVDEAIRATL